MSGSNKTKQEESTLLSHLSCARTQNQISMEESFNREMPSFLNRPWLSQETDKSQSSRDYNLGVFSCSGLNATEKTPKLGMEFDTIHQAREFWRNYGGVVGFDIRQLYANKSQIDKCVNSLRFVCAKEGHRRQDKRDSLTKIPRAETRTGCPVKMTLKLVRESGKYVISDLDLKHNRILQTSETSHMMPSQRKISEVQALQIDLADDSGIRPKETHELITKQAGGKNVIGYTKQDQKNYLRSKRKRELAYGEAGSLLRYFQRQLHDNPSFHHALQLDSEEKITNIFWADARMIIDYALFGDVITFDTTYCTNKENRPFESFFAAHKLKSPRTIFTDQDPPMAKALATVMPNTYHGLCVWHIMQNAIRHLGNMMKTGSCILKDFKACMYDYEDESKFHEAWYICFAL